MIQKNELNILYNREGKSLQEIADIFGCSVQKVRYWMDKYDLSRRTISDAVYLKSNPEGDPFSIKKPQTLKEAYLYGLGIGLYWGEGTKANKHSVRLGNTDPSLIKKFIEFLETCFQMPKSSLRFGLQVFSDMSAMQARNFWVRKLGVSKNQFQKVVVTKARSVGTYRKKIQYGVLTVYFHNVKLRNILCDEIENM